MKKLFQTLTLLLLTIWSLPAWADTVTIGTLNKNANNCSSYYPMDNIDGWVGQGLTLYKSDIIPFDGGVTINQLTFYGYVTGDSSSKYYNHIKVYIANTTATTAAGFLDNKRVKTEDMTLFAEYGKYPTAAQYTFEDLVLTSSEGFTYDGTNLLIYILADGYEDYKTSTAGGHGGNGKFLVAYTDGNDYSNAGSYYGYSFKDYMETGYVWNQSYATTSPNNNTNVNWYIPVMTVDYTTTLPSYTVSLSGSVADRNGSGIEGATVKIDDDENLSVATGTDGSYSFENISLEKGNHTVSVYVSGIKTNEYTLNVQASGDYTQNFTVTLATVTGKVSNSGGQGIANAIVRLNTDGVFNATTNTSGNYTIANIPYMAGNTYTFYYSADNYETTTVDDLDLSAGGTITKNVTLTKSPAVVPLETVTIGTEDASTYSTQLIIPSTNVAGQSFMLYPASLLGGDIAEGNMIKELTFRAYCEEGWKGYRDLKVYMATTTKTDNSFYNDFMNNGLNVANTDLMTEFMVASDSYPEAPTAGTWFDFVLRSETGFLYPAGSPNLVLYMSAENCQNVKFASATESDAAYSAENCRTRSADSMSAFSNQYFKTVAATGGNKNLPVMKVGYQKGVPGVTIIGSVKDEAGNAVGGATVTFGLSVTSTDTDGLFSVNIPAVNSTDVYTLTVSKTGFHDYTNTYTGVQSGQIFVETIVLDDIDKIAVTISGTVYAGPGEDAETVAYATVYMGSLAEGGGGYSTEADENGVYTLTISDAATLNSDYVLHASADGFGLYSDDMSEEFSSITGTVAQFTDVRIDMPPAELNFKRLGSFDNNYTSDKFPYCNYYSAGGDGLTLYNKDLLTFLSEGDLIKEIIYYGKTNDVNYYTAKIELYVAEIAADAEINSNTIKNAGLVLSDNKTVDLTKFTYFGEYAQFPHALGRRTLSVESTEGFRYNGGSLVVYAVATNNTYGGWPVFYVANTLANTGSLYRYGTSATWATPPAYASNNTASMLPVTSFGYAPGIVFKGEVRNAVTNELLPFAQVTISPKGSPETQYVWNTGNNGKYSFFLKDAAKSTTESPQYYDITVTCQTQNDPAMPYNIYTDVYEADEWDNIENVAMTYGVTVSGKVTWQPDATLGIPDGEAAPYTTVSWVPVENANAAMLAPAKEESSNSTVTDSEGAYSFEINPVADAQYVVTFSNNFAIAPVTYDLDTREPKVFSNISNVIVNTAVDSILMDGDTDVEMFTIDGVRVDANNAGSGLYIIRKSNGQTRKVMVK